MRQRTPEFFEDEAWQMVSAEADELVRELVAQSDPTKPLKSFRLRLVRDKINQLRQRLGDLKQRLQQHLAGLQEARLNGAADIDTRYVLRLGAERLADMWLLECSLARLAAPAPARASWPDKLRYSA